MTEEEIRQEIELFIETWKDSLIGQQVKGMLKRGCKLEEICEVAGIRYGEED